MRALLFVGLLGFGTLNFWKAEATCNEQERQNIQVQLRQAQVEVIEARQAVRRYNGATNSHTQTRQHQANRWLDGAQARVRGYEQDLALAERLCGAVPGTPSRAVLDPLSGEGTGAGDCIRSARSVRETATPLAMRYEGADLELRRGGEPVSLGDGRCRIHLKPALNESDRSMVQRLTRGTLLEVEGVHQNGSVEDAQKFANCRAQRAEMIVAERARTAGGRLPFDYNPVPPGCESFFAIRGFGNRGNRPRPVRIADDQDRFMVERSQVIDHIECRGGVTPRAWTDDKDLRAPLAVDDAACTRFGELSGILSLGIRRVVQDQTEENPMATGTSAAPRSRVPQTSSPASQAPSATSASP